MEFDPEVKKYFDQVKTKIQANPRHDYLHGVICFDDRWTQYNNAPLAKALNRALIDECSEIFRQLVERDKLSEIGYMFYNRDHVILEIFGKNTKQTFIARVKKLSKIPAVFGWEKQ